MMHQYFVQPLDIHKIKPSIINKLKDNFEYFEQDQHFQATSCTPPMGASRQRTWRRPCDVALVDQCLAADLSMHARVQMEACVLGHKRK